MNSRIPVCVLLVGALFSLTGCDRGRKVTIEQTSAVRQDVGERGHVIVLPGIGGWHWTVRRLTKLINEEVEGMTASSWDWTKIEPAWAMTNLMDYERNRRRSKVLANKLVAFREAHPDAPLYLAATSGGVGMIYFICEDLPPDFELERVIFISGALSPDADLTPILSRTRNGIFSYRSWNDWLILGLGTTCFGTMDRKYTASCGLVGWAEEMPPEQAARIDELAWRPAMIGKGNLGMHFGGFATSFIREHVLPVFRNGAQQD